MAAAEHIADAIALKLQELRARQSAPRPLLRIDNRDQTAHAPVQFDPVTGRAHRNGCRAIPAGSRTALYGLWGLPPQLRDRACTVCRPRPEERDEVADVSDYLYGVLSVIDQFGSVIRERGREFRDSEEGRQLKAGLDSVYQNLEERQRATLQAVLSSLDGLLQTVEQLEASLDGDKRQNGRATRNGDRPDPDH